VKERPPNCFHALARTRPESCLGAAGNSSFKVEYEKPMVELSGPLSARRALAQLDPNFVEAKRFNRHLRATGPYCEDTRAIIDRMLMEGCRPDVQSWIQLIRAYHDAQPPQAAKAELVLAEMRAHNVAVTAQASSLLPVLTGHVSSLLPVLTGHVSCLSPY